MQEASLNLSDSSDKAGVVDSAEKGVPPLSNSRSLAMVYTRTLAGVTARRVIVEVHLANGLPMFSIVGLPETAVRESKDRVRGAILNSGFEFPAKRITVNLSPADIPKTGSRFDLPIALGILAASDQVPTNQLDDYEFVGELALDGHLRKISGILPTAIAAGGANKKLVVPSDNSFEASLPKLSCSYAAPHLIAVCRHLANQGELAACESGSSLIPPPEYPDLGDVKGQHQAKRALEIAASGGHSVLFMGTPGTGKSMLAARFPGILPPLTVAHALESAAVRSVAKGEFDLTGWRQRPFRSPHHSASPAALVGGGSMPTPGEISLAHRGVLFLDELTEFSRSTLEQLREPLETGVINIARASLSVQYPAQFTLLAACNPCRCGYLGDGTDRCRCSAANIETYRQKLSGPLLDRIDMHVHLQRVPTKQLQQSGGGESTAAVQARVVPLQRLQHKRQAKLNCELTTTEIARWCEIDQASQAFFELASERLHLSARAYHRILRLARTIADMAGADKIQQHHLSEAIGYRKMDRR